MTTPAVPPIHKRITVSAPPGRAFEVFTAEMTRWWNPEYKLGSEPLASVVMEPRVGGRWFERGTGGAECDWGRVLVWEPPGRVVLAWQIGADWRYDPALHTELEVRFVEDERGGTRVELEHRGLEAFGGAAESMRATLDGLGGWEGLLQRLTAALAPNA